MRAPQALLLQELWGLGALALLAAGPALRPPPVTLDDVSSSVSATCLVALDRLCAGHRLLDGPIRCRTCAGQQQGALRRATCNNTQIDAYCAALSQPSWFEAAEKRSRHTAAPTPRGERSRLLSSSSVSS